MYVVTADQRDSRSGPDLVPTALADLATVRHGAPIRPFERTVGDEIQALFDEPSSALVVLPAPCCARASGTSASA